MTKIIKSPRARHDIGTSPVALSNMNKGFWQGVAQNFIATVLGGIVVVAVGAYFAKPWIEAKIVNLIHSTINGSQNQPVSIQGNGNDLNQSIKNLNQTIKTIGDKNITASLQGDHIVNSQNINEIRTDFKQDTPQSDMVIEQINKGLAIYNALDRPGVKDEEADKIWTDIDSWFKETTEVLSKISRKASVYFQNVDITGPGMSYPGGQKAGELRAVLRKCLNALNDILKTS